MSSLPKPILISGRHIGSGLYLIQLQTNPSGSLDIQVRDRVQGSQSPWSNVISITSSITLLTITMQPSNQTVFAEQSATFAVHATSGTGFPLQFQWKKDGSAIPNATATTYTIAAAQLADSNTRYSVTITDGLTTLESTPALLTVVSIDPPPPDPLPEPSVPFAIKDVMFIDTGNLNAGAQYGTTAALIYQMNVRRLAMWQDSSTPRLLELPGLSDPRTECLTTVLQNPSELWTWSVNRRPMYAFDPDTQTRYLLPALNPPTLRHYSVSATPTLMNSWEIGDTSSVPSTVLALADGSIFCAGYQIPTTFEATAPMFVARCDGSQLVMRSGPILDGSPTATGQTFIVSAQHPATGMVWLFSKADSFHRMQATVVDPTSLRIVQFIPDFISPSDGIDNVEGEFPWLTAIPDAARKMIHIAYQNNHYEILATLPQFVKGSWVSIASVDANGMRAFTRLESLVERISTLDLSLAPNGDFVLIGSAPLLITPPYCIDLSAWRYSKGSWMGPLSLGRKQDVGAYLATHSLTVFTESNIVIQKDNYALTRVTLSL